MGKSGLLLLEFFVCLVKVLWIILVSSVKLVLPFWYKEKDVSKETVLITGSGSGIGRLMAIKFAKLGAKVVLWDINKEGNEAVQAEIKSGGGKAYAYRVDCSKRGDISEAADKVRDEVGDVTILVNNAGVVTGKKFYELPEKMVDLTFRVNTIAHLWTIKEFFPAMKKKNQGHVITIASSAGLFGVATLMDYCASKFGAVGIHESLVGELSALNLDGIKTTLVCPFFINTGMFDGVRTRIPLVMPILEPDYAVSKIMTAFHSDQYMLMMPRMLYVFYILQAILPKKALLEAAQFFGANTSMDTFKGRQKKD